MRNPFVRFTVRWLVCSLGLWITASILSRWVSYGNHLEAIIIAGLVLAIVNTILRPIIIILSLPAVLLSLGLFMVIINGLMVYIASRLYTPLHVTNFGAAILAGLVIGLVNYLVTTILESRQAEQ